MTTDAPPVPAVAAHRSLQPLGPFRRTVREVGLGLITAGVIVLLFVAYQLFGTNLTEAHNQAALKKSFTTELHSHAPVPAPAGGATTKAPGSDNPTVGGPPTIATPSGGAIDHLVIPKLGLDKYVVDGTDESSLSRGPGHYQGTPYPGQPGNVGIAGHRTTYGAPFYRLDELTIGDDVYLTDTTGHTFRYQVDQAPMVVAPSDVAVLDPTPTPTLTLTTCNPRFSATSRLIVKAKLVGLPVATPAPAPAVTTPTSASGGTPAARSTTTAAVPTTLTAGTHSAWPPALLYGAAVVVLWVATRIAVNRTRRWRRAGALVGGIGVCCIPLWFCFENVVRLLPQSI
ncbi:class E sortase [Acidiferrimicrobium sp. IK]|uniref:class E sortase n=1 Tax=Acidiferrimicrobium sp. IK TaxID=2871700 RepID=UPI0021CB3A09|nr:class E sortase [Acidiferrimicrobium sp. IK]MCU4185090.1 class E sortase [Acidiferrimicrobium sp. IK]